MLLADNPPKAFPLNQPTRPIPVETFQPIIQSSTNHNWKAEAQVIRAIIRQPLDKERKQGQQEDRIIKELRRYKDKVLTTITRGRLQQAKDTFRSELHQVAVEFYQLPPQNSNIEHHHYRLQVVFGPAIFSEEVPW